MVTTRAQSYFNAHETTTMLNVIRKTRDHFDMNENHLNVGVTRLVVVGRRRREPMNNQQILKKQLRRKMNLWSNNTLVPSQPFSEISFHDNRM